MFKIRYNSCPHHTRHDQNYFAFYFIKLRLNGHCLKDVPHLTWLLLISFHSFSTNPDSDKTKSWLGLRDHQKFSEIIFVFSSGHLKPQFLT